MLKDMSIIPGKRVLTATLPTYMNESMADPVLEVTKSPHALMFMTAAAPGPGSFEPLSQNATGKL